MGCINSAFLSIAIALCVAAQSIRAAEVVRYRDFGARGDGKSDDVDAIAKAHAFANQRGLPVKADDGATYYIGGKNKTVVIQTDTDFGAAKFIIDDTSVVKRFADIFEVRSKLKPVHLKGIRSLKRSERSIGVPVPQRSVVVVTNSKVKHFIRYGNNRNNGASQTDVFIVDKRGNIDVFTPLIWDFDQVTGATAYPIDETTVTITGGQFTTVANAAKSNYSYYSRGIAIRRSNVVVDGLEHRITGEGEYGAPYGGFIDISTCANVTVRNTALSGHRTYRTTGSAGRPVSMGTYDISLNRALNVAFVNCRQINDINDRSRWGIMGSNYCKNLLLDGCSFSRFDAHKGVANATIRNSTLGHAGINAIGCGRFVLENCTIYGRHLIYLRPDYGSTWRGEFTIRNCTFVPGRGSRISASLIGGSYSGQHNFGYTCSIPARVNIDKLHIDDKNHPKGYRGAAVFANFNGKNRDKSYVEKYPYVARSEVVLKGVTTASGKPLRGSDNSFMFRDVKMVKCERPTSNIEHPTSNEEF